MLKIVSLFGMEMLQIVSLWTPQKHPRPNLSLLAPGTGHIFGMAEE